MRTAASGKPTQPVPIRLRTRFPILVPNPNPIRLPSLVPNPIPIRLPILIPNPMPSEAKQGDAGSLRSMEADGLRREASVRTRT